MSRTIRNRHTTPKEFQVHDGGRLYLEGRGRFTLSLFDEINCWPTYRRSPFRCERTSYRRKYNRQYRKKSNLFVRTGRFDQIMPPRRSSGWLSW